MDRETVSERFDSPDDRKQYLENKRTEYTDDDRELFGSDSDDDRELFGSDSDDDRELFGSDSDDEYENLKENSCQTQCNIKGMTILEKEIKEIELEKLIEYIKPRLVNNQTMHFGDLPSELNVLFKYGNFNQMIANYYKIGDGIIDHVDLERFEDKVLICSLYGLELLTRNVYNRVQALVFGLYLPCILETWRYSCTGRRSKVFFTKIDGTIHMEYLSGHLIILMERE
ncbi:hypothetical protein HK103_006074 [Boothiomyces macroporosus]|uniref:Uncharacterized protein n=1 Tax=Boothiomyces macroporosus TaxID=261099 RepID=A0AAD5UE91_9FUNG|nr:hypothetical protein HK103_006074 [Boothiomyces macroporosus]